MEESMAPDASTISIIQNALPGLEMELQKVYEALHELEEDEFQRRHSEDYDSAHADSTRDRLPYLLKRVSQLVLMCLEAAGLVATRVDFQNTWKIFDLSATEPIQEYDILYSEPCDYLKNTIEGLRLIANNGESPTETVDLQRLRDLLEATPTFLRKRNMAPQREHDIQKIMVDYLEACFPRGLVSSPTIPGFVKNFKADAGVLHLKAAVEFKFASSLPEVKQAMSGIIEDTAGYKGSLDWTRFYSVVYMTEPFVQPARFRADMARVGALNWVLILVNGAGEKPKHGRKDIGKTEQGEQHIDKTIKEGGEKISED
jgi:hypothetical protein